MPDTLHDRWVPHGLCDQGFPVTSLIVPRELKEHLPPLADYAPPEDQSGATDIRVRDHQPRTLRVDVWFHQLDMALSEEPASSGSLVRSRHWLRNLLAYFLGPGTTWELQFEDVVTQVIKENLRHVEKRCTNVASSLRKCNKQWTQLCTKFDATSEAMQVVADAPSGRELEHRLSSLQTSLTMIEKAITRYENIIEDCRMQEEEACQEEEISHEQEEEEVTDAEMVEEEECGDAEPSDPQGAADTEDIPPLDPAGDAVSPEEDAFLMQMASQSEDPTAGSHSPRSKTGTVSGEMADLSLTSPSQPGPGEDKTQQWVSTSVLLVIGARLHCESLPLQVEELGPSPPSPHPGRVWRKKSGRRRQGRTRQKREGCGNHKLLSQLFNQVNQSRNHKGGFRFDRP